MRALLLSLLLTGCSTEPPPPPLAPGWTVSPVEQVRHAGQQARTLSDPTQFDAAARALDQLLAQDACNTAALEARGQLLVDRFRYDAERGHAEAKPDPAALASYEAALACDPSHTGALHGMGWYYEQIGEHGKALAAYRRMAEATPDDPGVHMILGTALLQTGHYAEAAASLEILLAHQRQIEDREQAMPTLDKLGRAYIRLGEYERAEALLQESVEIVETLRREQGRQQFAACPYVALGQLYRSQGDDAQGTAMFIEAAELESVSPEAQGHAAQYLFWSGELEQALVYADRAIALQDNPDYHALKQQIEQAIAGGAPSPSTQAVAAFDAAVRAFDRYDFEQAGAFVERAIEAEPITERLVLQAMVFLMQARYDDAEAALDRAVHSGQDPAAIAIGRGHLAIARKDYTEARKLFSAHMAGVSRYGSDRGLEMEPTGWQWLLFELAHLGMGWVHANQGHHETAIEYFDKVLRIQPTDHFALIGRGNAYNALGKLDLAEADLGRVLELDPGNMYATAELGLVELNRGDVESAQQHFEQAKDMAPTTYTCPHEGLGMVYLRKGDLGRAKEHFEQAIAINPDIEFRKYNGLATIYINEGRYDEAEALLQRSMENYPHDDEAAELLARIQELREGE